jgi:hypothetical protein
MKARFINESFINEEVIGSFKGSWGAGEITIFKNPVSVKRMAPWVRAFTDQDGNFYVGDEENASDTDRIGTTHTTIMSNVKAIDNNIKTKWYDIKGMYIAGIGWQRAGKTNMFYLSESYIDAKRQGMEEDMMAEVKKIMSLPNFYKPSDMKFVLEIIDTSYDYVKMKSRFDYIPSQTWNRS